MVAESIPHPDAEVARFVTPSAWAEAQRGNVDELLLEQAHLEKKAAAGAVAFLFRLPLHRGLHRRLSALGREELVHFERTLKLLEQRGVAFARQPSSGYAERLKRSARREHRERLVDELLIAAIIEFRSHERMTLLAAALDEVAPEVAAFYADLCPAEERHERLYLDLTTLLADADAVRARHVELLAVEAQILRESPFAARLHSGLPRGDAGSSAARA
ncbi:MAG TPA: tRNA-(ms[2]io[6]A)-hydroxylase [bacterium]|nr:tRNA-(ms[2]io[6]A)-hydroxylase [bacterium]